MKFSVGLPTAGRSLMLRAALDSIRAQSRPDLITEIIVSENGGDPASADIVREYPDLPIVYRTRQPCLEVSAHFIQLVTELQGPWVALLGDDDMWGRYHLEEAARQLLNDPDATGFTSQTVSVGNESRQVRNGFTRLLRSYPGGNGDGYRACWRWDAEDLLVESLMRTPLNLWALVVQKTCLLKAMDFFDEGGLYLDSDRYLFWRLAMQGPVLVGREVGLFYRTHENANSTQLEKSEPAFHFEISKGYTLRMIADAESAGINWRLRWSETWNSLSSRDQREVWKESLRGARSALESVVGPLVEPPAVVAQDKWKRLCKLALPPLVSSLLSRGFRLAARYTKGHSR
ncbi:MAG: hypothetical protein B7Z37_11615 [Verrucomicrobia bacterium 12-59-8]|nr:MAG: hypothetical protein B7Z37_11615 [Verrucomicrobia bacterium 12-59-8]